MLAGELHGYSPSSPARMVGWQGSATGSIRFNKRAKLYLTLVCLKQCNDISHVRSLFSSLLSFCNPFFAAVMLGTI